MAIRTITWTVDDDMQVTPTRVQDAGVQGDDYATRVVFSLPAFLQTRHRLYIECVDNVGGYDKTDPLTVSNGAVSFDLPLEWTQHGGEATLRLVAAEMIGDIENVVAYSRPGCRIRFAGRAKAFAKIKSLIEGSIQMAMEKLAAAQDRIAKMIADAKVWIDNVNGVYVGSGDMPDGCVIQIDPTGEALLLDDEMSDESENVPKTKVVKEYVDAIAIESTEHPGCYYRMVDGDVEWLNPPLDENWTGYRTTKRYNGKPVFMVRFISALPNNTSLTNEYVFDNAKVIGYTAATREGVVIPMKRLVADGDNVYTREINLYVTASECSILTNFDASSQTAEITLEYVYN